MHPFNKNMNRLISTKSNILFLNKQLYYIGLSHYPCGSQRRKNMFNPIFIAMITITIITRDMISLFINDEKISLMLGNYAFKWRFKTHWNITAILGFFLTLIIQFLHFWPFYQNKHNYWNNLQINVQNKNPSQKTSKRFFFAIDFIIRYFTPIFFCFFSFVPLYISCSFKEIIIYGIPWSIAYGFLTLYAFGILLYQLIYFCLISYECRLNLIIANSILRAYLFKSKPTKKQIKIFNNFDKIYREIYQMNIFWSNYLFWNWFILSIILIILIFIILTEKLEIITSLTLILTLVCGIIYLLTLVISSTALYNEANKTYSISNSFMLVNNKRNASLSVKLKV
jgi:hypothetical protein